MSSQDWPVDNASTGWLNNAGRGGTEGDQGHVFALASVTKPLFAFAVLVALEEGTVNLSDRPLLNADPARFPGNIPGTAPNNVTVQHLLCHASGLGPEIGDSAIEPGKRRIYSNAGFELLGEHLASTSSMTVAQYMASAVFEPLAMASTRLLGSAAHGAESCVKDLLAFIDELLAPTLIDPSTLRTATTTVFASLGGVLPGFGLQEPNAWGLGFELKGSKRRHWTAPENSASTFGHFGASGTMLWVDPVAKVGAVALTDQKFGPWAQKAWPRFSQEVLRKGSYEPFGSVS